MKRIAFLALVIAACGVLGAQPSPPAAVFDGNCVTGLPRFEEWYQQTKLPYGEPYLASDRRKHQVLESYPNLTHEMSLVESEKLLGKPDFATGVPIPHLANVPESSDRQCKTEVAYILRKKSENMTDTEDVAVYLFFSRDGKLYWVSPQNLSALKPLGSPTGPTIVQSQALWKEYSFADDGFAVTLPEAPKPHVDATLPEFTVYSVHLPGNAMLSLRVSRRDRDCTATLAEIEEGAVHGKSGIDPSSVKHPSIDGAHGLEYEYALTNGGSISSDRFYCANGRFYAFSSNWSGQQVPPASVELVLVSFRLLNTNATSSPQ